MARNRQFDLARKSFRLLKIVAINLFVLFVLLELASLAGYFYKKREFFYTRNTSREKAAKAQIETDYQLNSASPSLNLQLHPYFGFVYRQGFVQDNSIPTNNYGFLSPHDLPFRKSNQNQFIVGVFGGSVAARYSFYEFENHVLATALRRIPSFQNREVIILNFGSGAYKEPQQLLVLNYFLSIGQDFDAVVNIDGFNETAISAWNNRSNMDISMPVFYLTLPLIDLANKGVSPEELTLTLEFLQTKQHLKDALNHLYSSRLATSYMLRWLQVKYLLNQYQKKAKAFSELKRNGPGKDSLVYVNRVETPVEDSKAYEQMAALWANSSLAMKDLLSAKKIQYFHFIQPNQYYATGRVFSEAERKIAISEGGPYQAGVVRGYPVLLSKISSLQGAGVRLFNAVNVFDQVKESVYVDDCCHFTPVGSEIFANYVARSIAATLDTQPAMK